MIRCRLSHLRTRCLQRGYTLEESRPCIVSEDGDWIVVDEHHPAYPKAAEATFLQRPQQIESVSYGPGTELSKLLKRFGVEPTPTCSCRAKAAQMNAWGCDECSRPERIEEVVGVMREEAKARGLPFLDLPARLLVRRAIANARKAEAARAREAERPPLHTEQ
jgi:hypothetical protein